MPRAKLTKRGIEAAAVEPKPYMIWDTEVRGFGLWVAPSGRKTFYVKYRTKDGSVRKPAIGSFPTIRLEDARAIASEWVTEARRGGDVSQGRREARDGLTVKDLCERYLVEHARPKKKPSSLRKDEQNIQKHVLPAFGSSKLAAIEHADIVRLHGRMSATPGSANRVVALLSKMFNLAERWSLRPLNSNPCRHLVKYSERKVERYLSELEYARLARYLREAGERQTERRETIAAFRLLCLTGCRVSEILGLQWDEVDFDLACLRLRDSKTGPRAVPLSTEALEVLQLLPHSKGQRYVLPERDADRPVSAQAFRHRWERIWKDVNLGDVRIHDLRHSFASMAIAAGMSLPMVGKLLGHRTPSTTARYAHLADDPLRDAARQVGRKIASSMGSEGGERP